MALKGIGNGGEGSLANRQRESLNLDWGYGWSAECPGTGFGPHGFVPMIWGGSNVNDRIATVLKEIPETKATHLLGFNEPDLANSSYLQQSNISVGKALDLWPKLERTGLRLGAPATIKPTAEWLDRFMAKAEAKGLRIDFMPVHIYGWPNSESFLEKLENLYKKYQLPIWVTEYAVADWDAKETGKFKYKSSQVRDFMQETVDGMNALPYVERYAWKTRAHGDLTMGYSALFHSDNKTLTPTGELYASL